MKPIKLSVKGLHSFREKQTVDFEALCEGGVFGIFGPTGSGKSSLLDAMTLALYGKVERAPNNTQGILNHAEDTLAVSFTFQLGHGGRAKRYEVERTFKRSGEANIRSATCRFIDITVTPEVIADKAGDVTKAVEDLLGLSIDDFTRAVVLPQGKFSEFLSLKGSDRRQMLQRLFHLEKYGDELIAKLKSRLSFTKQEIEKIESEQAGLGNASKEAVEEAKGKVAQLTKELEDTRKSHELLGKQLEEEKTIRKWIEEKARVEKALSELLQQEKGVEELERKLKMALEAAVLLPYVNEMEDSKQSVITLEKEVTDITLKWNQLKEGLEKAEKEYEQAKLAKEQQETPLRLKLDEYSRILEELTSIKKEESALVELGTSLEKLHAEIEEIKGKKAKGEDDLRRYEEAQRDLKAKLQGLEVPLEEKKQIQVAMEEKRSLLQITSKWSELQGEKASLLEKKSDLDKEMTIGEEAVASLKAQLTNIFKQLYQWYERASEEEREIGTFYKRLKEQKEELEKEKRHLLANQLRQDLQEDKPCPVCGSLHHPLSEVAAVADSHGDEDYLWIEATMEQIRSEERNLEHLKWRLAEETRKLNDVFTADEVGKLSAVEVKSVGLLNQSREVFEAQWVNYSNKLRKEKVTIESLLTKVDDLYKQYQVAQDVVKGIFTNQKSYHERVVEMEKRIQEQQEQYESLKKQWQESYPHFSLEEMEGMVATLQKKEEEATICRQRIEKSQPFIEGKQKEIARLQEKLQELLVSQSSLNSELTQRQKAATDKKTQIHEVVGDTDVQSQMDKVNRDLEQLTARFKHGEAVWKQTSDAFKEIEQRYTVSQESLKHARERLDRAEVNWSEQLKRTSFDSIEEVKHASLTDAQMKQMEDAITQFNREKEQLRIKRDNCEKELGDKSISEEQFEQTVTVFNESKGKLEELGSERGGALATLKELEQRVQRYEKLEEERKQLKVENDRLAKLDHVFRGKAFVEYIAEEQLVQVSRLASERLHSLTRGRYAIEVDSSGGFIIRDDANGGVRRPVSTLSGGETFLTSLALALSLSASIQLKGEHPLEFFFLDEGFGTLDQELLEIVINALEKLHTDNLSVGVISHVPELRERLPRKLIVSRAEDGGKGSSVRLESM
ncbi:exonuclease SbcC [Evansella vedderi]|uniref:Nuclease SbcCD subunit C n=1 Tax=Evansella vedderi TaxID=38282 RepID=A0ABT9ZV93_9BACI|nr:SMC family ATPase [Evansella vedderi]MDQ0255166.1 exonuclease SbcC [Evansella vedderi]